MTIQTKPGELYVEASSNSFITKLPLRALSIDPNLQRIYIKPQRIRKMADDFDPNALGVLEVSQRLSGMNHTLDGYHRVLMLRELRKRGDITEEYPVTCKVFVGLTTVQEAELFALLNNRENVGRMDLFRIKLAAKNPDALDIMRILEENKWHLLGSSQGTRGVAAETGGFAAIASLEAAYAISSVSAEKSIRTLTRAWDHTPATVNGSLVGGMARFYTFYGNAADLDRMVSMLAKYKHGPRGFLTAAQSKRDMIRGTTENSVANLAEEIYNVGKSTKSLPVWPRNGRRDSNLPQAINTLPDRAEAASLTVTVDGADVLTVTKD